LRPQLPGRLTRVAPPWRQRLARRCAPGEERGAIVRPWYRSL